MRLQIIYNIYKEDLTLNNLQELICPKTHPNQTNSNLKRESLGQVTPPVKMYLA